MIGNKTGVTDLATHFILYLSLLSCVETIISNFQGAEKESMEVTLPVNRKEIGNLSKEFGS